MNEVYDLNDFTKEVYKIVKREQNQLEYIDGQLLLCTMRVDPNRWNNEKRHSIIDSRYAEMRTDVAYVTSIVDILTGKSYQHGYCSYIFHGYDSLKYTVGQFVVADIIDSIMDTLCFNSIYYFTTKDGAYSYVSAYLAENSKGYYLSKKCDVNGFVYELAEYYNGKNHGICVSFKNDNLFAIDVMWFYMGEEDIRFKPINYTDLYTRPYNGSLTGPYNGSLTGPYNGSLTGPYNGSRMVPYIY